MSTRKNDKRLQAEEAPALPLLPAEGSSSPSESEQAHDFTGGHRDRLRARFLSHGGEAMSDEELLEMLLFAVNPRKDVKPLAKLLLKTFGAVGAVLNAPAEKLRGLKAEGVALSTDNAVAMVRLAGALGVRMLKREMQKETVLSSWDALVNYCCAAMADEPVEQFRIIFLNRRNAVIADEVQQRGTVDHTPVYPREIMRRAIELGASALVLVHNHPSGDPAPSRADIDMTKEIIRAAQAVGVTIHDHLVIGKGRHVSFKAKGLMG
jgi:DNA repair protein RadC